MINYKMTDTRTIISIGNKYKLSKVDNAVYWVKEGNYNSTAELCYDFTVKEMLEELNLTDKYSGVYEEVKHAKSNNVNCGNSWLLVTEREREIICKMRPKQNERPIYSKGSVNVSTSFRSFEDALDHLSEAIGSDCWGAYTRDTTSKPVKIYFDTRKKDDDETQNAREKLQDKNNLEKELRDAQEKEHTFCCVMGGEVFYDHYYYPIKDGFIFIEVEYEI